MAADLFETYAVTAVAVILLGVLTFHEATRVALYPLVIGGAAIIASIIGTFAVRTKTDNVERALLQGLTVSGLIAAAAFAPITYWLMRSLTFTQVGSAVNTPKWWHLYLCSLIGIAVTALLFGLTEYYTSTRFSPVKKTAKASITGHATNIIQGFSSGLQATALPALVIVLGILDAWKLAGGGDREGFDHGPRHEHHPGLQLGAAGHGATGPRDRARHPRRMEARRRRSDRHLRDPRGGDGSALVDRADRRARRLRSDHRQRRRHRRDGRSPRGGAQGYRSARRGREHDQGRHEGLRDRLC